MADDQELPHPFRAVGRGEQLGAAARSLVCLAALAAGCTFACALYGAEAALGQAHAPDEVVEVTAPRLEGLSLEDLAPDFSLDPSAIRAFGAATVEELLDELAPQLDSGRGTSGRPVILVNGRSSAGFREVRRYPPEAIERIDVLPPEVALRYGFRATQRVVDIILSDRFNAFGGESRNAYTTEGAGARHRLDINYLRIRPEYRWSIDGRFDDQAAIAEADRDFRQDEEETLFAPSGNVRAALPGGELDSALSLLAGAPVTVAALPSMELTPTLEDFLAGANAPSRFEVGELRALLGEREESSLGGSFHRGLGPRVGLTLAGGVDLVRETDLRGPSAFSLLVPATNPFSPFENDSELLRSADRHPLVRERTTLSGDLALTLNGQQGPWTWSTELGVEYQERDTDTDRGIDVVKAQGKILDGDPQFSPFTAPVLFATAVRDRAQAIEQQVQLASTATRPWLSLPAGALSSTVALRAFARRQESLSPSESALLFSALNRSVVQASATLDVPIVAGAPGIGQLTLTLDGELAQYSDVGLIRAVGWGTRWRPLRALRVIAGFRRAEQAPSMTQLGDPLISVPNVRSFDYLTGESVVLTELTGGNPSLDAARENAWRVSLRARPLEKTDLTLSLDYLSTRTDDAIAAFPAATVEIREAFPDRFVLGDDGSLVSVDTRAINFARRRDERVRWGLTYSRPVARRATDGDGASAGDRAAPAPRRAPGVRLGRRGRGGERRGRYRVSAYHTWRFVDDALIAPGVPLLDFLDGSAAGRLGGTVAHEVSVRLSYTHRGRGARLRADWRGASVVAGDQTQAPLAFSDLLTVDLRLFLELSPRLAMVRKWPWLDGSRVSFEVENLLDEKIRVRDDLGVTPVRFQQDNIDPLGRTLELRLRKLFR